MRYLQSDGLDMSGNSEISPCERAFGHCIVDWAVENYGLSLWKKNLIITTPEFSINGPNSQNTKWKLTIQTDCNHDSLLEELKISIQDEKEQDGSGLLSKGFKEKVSFESTLSVNEKETLDLLWSNITKPPESTLSVKNLMLYLERSESDEGPSRVWVEWKVYYNDIHGEKVPLVHDARFFNKQFKYGFHIGTLYDFERDFEYNSSTMTFFCDMIVKDVDTDISFDNDIETDLLSLSDDLYWIFDKQKFCDAEIKVDGKNVKVHKAMLCAHTSFFEESFVVKESNVVEMSDVKYDEILKVLKYMYSHDLEDVIGDPSLSVCDLATQMNLTDLEAHYIPEERVMHTTIDVQKLTFAWTVTDFNPTESSCISSEVFSCHDIKDGAWQISLYPSDTDGTSEHISISVECIDGNISEDLCIQCAVLNDNEHLNVWKVLKPDQTNPDIFKKKSFIEREDVIKHLKDKSLQIGLKVRTINEMNSSSANKLCMPVLYSMKKSFENLRKNMFTLYESNRYTDVVLKIGDEEFKAHKFVLSARSCALSKQLEETNRILLQSISPVTMKTVLEYMYYATLNVSDIDAIIDVYKTAEELIIPRLQDKCSRFLQNNVTLDNVSSFLKLADEYNDNYLKAIALQVAGTNEHLFEPQALKDLMPKTHRLWFETEGGPRKPGDKPVFKYYVDSLTNYEFEIVQKTLNEKDIKGEENGENKTCNLDDITKKSISSDQLVSEYPKAPDTIGMKTAEMEKPVTCEIGSPSKLHQNSKMDLPFKKRYSNGIGVSDNCEGKVVVAKAPQATEVNNLIQTKDEGIKSVRSPNKTPVKKPPSDTVKTIESDSEKNDESEISQILRTSKEKLNESDESFEAKSP